MKQNDKIGLAVITYNRPVYLRRVLDRLKKLNWGGANEILVVVDEHYCQEKYGWLNQYSVDVLYHYCPVV